MLRGATTTLVAAVLASCASASVGERAPSPDAGPGAAADAEPVDAWVAYDGPLADAVPAMADATPRSACGVASGITIELGNRTVAVDDGTEASYVAPLGQVLTGVGARVSGDNVVTMRARVQAVLAAGALGSASEARSGVEPGGSVEANVELPPCHVVVGIGGRINQDQLRTLAVWGAPMLADGSLGAPEEFRGGTEPAAALELEYHAPAGWVVSGLGLRSSNDNLGGLAVVVDEWRIR